MSGDDSITAWIHALDEGDERAATQLWQRYYVRLTAIVCKKLRSSLRRVADEEDIVVSAFESFFRRAQRGEFPNLKDRDDLWRLLATIADRKAQNQVRDLNRQKRGGGRVRGDSALGIVDSDGRPVGIEHLADREPTPQEAAIVTEACQAMLGALKDEQREVAVCKLEGYTNAQIANKLDCSVSAVERRLRLIRRIWSQME